MELNNKITAGIGILSCCSLLYLATPRFISNLSAIYPETAYKQLDTLIPRNILENCVADLVDAVSWQKDPTFFKKQGVFYLKIVEQIPLTLSNERSIQLKQAQKSFIEGLTLSPVDPIAWYQLAYVDNLLNEPIEHIINDLRLSYYAGRVEPEYTMPRLKLIYRYLTSLPEDLKSILNNQISLAWHYNPQDLIEYSAKHPDFKKMADNYFNIYPEENSKFNKQLANYIKKHP